MYRRFQPKFPYRDNAGEPVSYGPTAKFSSPSILSLFVLFDVHLDLSHAARLFGRIPSWDIFKCSIISNISDQIKLIGEKVESNL